MEVLHTPKQELTGRIGRLQDLLLKNGIGGALIVQKADLFYFSGTCQNAHLLVPAQGEPLLMVKKSMRRAREESALESVSAVNGLDDIIEKAVFVSGGNGKIGLEMDVLPANLFFKYKKLLSPLEVVDISKLIREIRMIKSSYEIERIREAALFNSAMFAEVPKILREGMPEVELAGKLESFCRQMGHQGAVRMRGFNQEIFYGHLMSGWNLTYPSFFDGPTGGTGLNPSFPQSAGYKKITRDEPIMVDYVGVYNGYMVDQARIFCIGELPGKLIDAYNASLKINEEIAESAAPGKNGKDLYEMAVRIAAESGYQENFMGCEERISFIGHGIGIELDELPVIAKNYNLVLQPGMVFALEPKFIFPELGAVGIEDTFAVTENGLEQITFFDRGIQYL